MPASDYYPPGTNMSYFRDHEEPEVVENYEVDETLPCMLCGEHCIDIDVADDAWRSGDRVEWVACAVTCPECGDVSDYHN